MNEILLLVVGFHYAYICDAFCLVVTMLMFVLLLMVFDIIFHFGSKHIWFHKMLVKTFCTRICSSLNKRVLSFKQNLFHFYVACHMT